MLKFLVTLLAALAAAAASIAEPITVSQRINVLDMPVERIIACHMGCYVLTQDELVEALQKAREGGIATGQVGGVR